MMQCDCSVDFGQSNNKSEPEEQKSQEEEIQVTDEMIQRAIFSPLLQKTLRKIKAREAVDLTEKAYEKTALYVAVDHAVADNTKDIVQILLQQGANPNTTNQGGNTALHKLAILAYSNDAKDRLLAVGELLLKKGASTEVKNSAGKAPLHIAALFGYEYMVKFLVDHGANKSARDNQGKTPLDLAMQKKHENSGSDTEKEYESIIHLLQL